MDLHHNDPTPQSIIMGMICFLTSIFFNIMGFLLSGVVIVKGLKVLDLAVSHFLQYSCWMIGIYAGLVSIEKAGKLPEALRFLFKKKK